MARLARSAVAAAALAAAAAQPPCGSGGLAFTGPDRPGSPLPVPPPYLDAQGCAFACTADALCRGYTWVAHGGGGGGCEACASPTGCCHLKAAADSGSLNATGCASTCSFVVRPDPASLPPLPPASPPAGARNVLYIVVDDLRPELFSYGARGMVTPHIDALAGQGVLFNRCE